MVFKDGKDGGCGERVGEGEAVELAGGVADEAVVGADPDGGGAIGEGGLNAGAGEVVADGESLVSMAFPGQR